MWPRGRRQRIISSLESFKIPASVPEGGLTEQVPWTGPWRVSTSSIASASLPAKPTRPGAKCCRACWRRKKPSSPLANPTSKSSNRISASGRRPRSMLLVVAPFPPVGRAHVEPFFGTGIHPAADNAPACENQRVRAIAVDDRQFEVAAIGRAGDGLPHSSIFGRIAGLRIDLCQIGETPAAAAAAA